MTLREQICIHESAHGLAAWRHAAELTGLRCNGTLNECRYKHEGNFGSDPQRIKELILIQLVGPCAEMKAANDLFNPELYEHEVKDLLERLAIFDRYHLPPGKTVEDFWAQHSAAARAFVSNPTNWRLIRLLADKLMSKQFMTGQQVAQYLEENYPMGRPEGILPWQQHHGE